MSDQPVPFKRYLPIIGIVSSVVLTGGGLGIWLKGKLGQEMKPMAPKIQVVDIVRPPPPPPKEEEPPPPPEMEEEELDLPEPEPMPELADANDEPPPGDQLGLDADGVAGSDGFGLVSNRGGRGLLSAGGGSAYRYYATRLKDELLSALSQIEEFRRMGYSIDIRLWVDDAGAVERAALAGTTGNAQIDSRLEQLLSSATAPVGRPPEGMPQPVRLRLVSRL